MPIKLLILDLDGTLVDTGQDIAEALNHALAPLGLKPMDVQAVTALVGEGIPNLIMKAVGPAHLHRADSVRDSFVRYYKAHLTDHSLPYPGVMETLASLKDSGYRMTVLSNKNTGMSVEILKRLDMHEHFELVLGGDTVEEKKPKPGGVLQTLSELGAEPGETVLIGDSSYDLDAAKYAGGRSIAVAYGFRPRETLLDADVLIDRFIDLPAAIKGLDSLTEKE